MLQKRFKDCELEVGCDEVGRGCLAGPVVAAVVLFPSDFYSDLIIDSKKLSKKKRIIAEQIIKENAIDYSVQEVSPKKIDEINILNASILAMHKCLDNLSIFPEHILVDGNKFKPYREIPYECVVKGDSKFLSIAAASILAKNYRDDLMSKLSKDFPHYNWESNAGYPTKKHREALVNHGVTIHHRKTFNLVSKQLKLSF
ncbi:MAG: ribonuclease HII [Flavobacteriales bacterium]|nr:ribonuclease HII [Flavobacteriales bacterium]